MRFVSDFELINFVDVMSGMIYEGFGDSGIFTSSSFLCVVCLLGKRIGAGAAVNCIVAPIDACTASMMDDGSNKTVYIIGNFLKYIFTYIYKFSCHSYVFYSNKPQSGKVSSIHRGRE